MSSMSGSWPSNHRKVWRRQDSINEALAALLSDEIRVARDMAANREVGYPNVDRVPELFERTRVWLMVQLKPIWEALESCCLTRTHSTAEGTNERCLRHGDERWRVRELLRSNARRPEVQEALIEIPWRVLRLPFEFLSTQWKTVESRICS
ncbi:UNVERIFIED_CONTAM: hypothetical protein LK11_07075 [Mumia flava]